MDSYPSGTEGQKNAFFYKFPWSWCDSQVIREKIEGRTLKPAELAALAFESHL